MKSDGNGGYIVQKGTFAFIMAIIALLSCVVTVVAYSVTIRDDVDFLKNEYEKSGPEHTKVISDIQADINYNLNTIIKNQERIISIQEDITEIKLDVKELIKK